MSLIYERLLNQPAPDHALIIEDEIEWTAPEFRERVNRLASVLAAKGIQPGDRVALMFMNQKEYLVGFFAILHAGAVVVPLNIQLPPEDILYVILNSGSKLILTTEQFAPHFEGKPIPILVSNQSEAKYPSFEEALISGDPGYPGVPSQDESAMRVLMYTSGTTGKPKGVMLSERNLLSNMEGVQPLLKLESTDRLLLALPLFHAYGLIIGLYALASGAAVYLVPNFAPKKIIQTLIQHRINILPLVPTMFNVLLGAVQKVGVENLKNLQLSVSGGASLPQKLLKQIEETLDMTVLEGYGLTETSPVLAVNSRDRGSIPGSVGQPLPNVQIKLVDDHGNTIPVERGKASGEGEILAKGPNVMLGYYNLPEENAQVFDSEGFLRTGDLGRFDEEGNLYISGGRKKDLIIKAGENIAPVRIEQVLYQHPAVQNASVIGIPDERLGESIMACVELKPEQTVSEQDIKKFCLEHLPPFMSPDRVRFYDELPKNPTGKIMKPLLRQQNVGASQGANS